MIPQLDVDLRVPPEQRWECLAAWRTAARELLAFYVRDIGGLRTFGPLLRGYCDAYVDPEYVAEMRGVARILDAPEEEVVLANLYYDAIKVVLDGGMACTAFALDTPSGPIHARNLDWTTADGRLASQTIIVNFHRGNGGPLYRTIGWPGFIGCLSGVAPRRFALTLNAVSSDDPPGLAAPISFLTRRVLETAETFAEAVETLRSTPIVSDSLLLLSGVHEGEMAVVERSPTRSAVRAPQAGSVLVTNDYRALPTSSKDITNSLAQTSCTRYDRAEELIRQTRPQDTEACLTVLRDPRVKMGITVQHLVLHALEGAITVALPS